MLLIRDFHPRDLSQVTILIADTFNRNYTPDFYISIFEGWKNGFLVAESESGIIGVLAAIYSAPKEARILLMAVRPEFRNRGIGTNMLKEFITRCFVSGIRAVNLEVRISNKKAVEFYGSQGFDTISLLPKYYEDGEAGYHMRKAL